MLLEASREQKELRDAAEEFLNRHAPSSALRHQIESGVTLDRAYWAGLAALGWTALLVPEEQGGGALSENRFRDLAMLAELSGEHVAPGPLVPANVVAFAIAEAGAEHQDVLDSIVDGSTVPTWAVAEGRGSFDPAEILANATKTADGYVLNGVKRFVEGAADADVIMVTVREGAGFAHFLVTGSTPGVTIELQQGLDPGRSYGTLALVNVAVPSSARVGATELDETALRHLLDVALALQVAETLGVMGHIWDLTLVWVMNRYAFGRPIGSYQALKHRLADHKLWLEASAGLVDGLLEALGSDDPDVSRIASIAKAHIGETAVTLVSDATQLHGGIGVTWEHDLHLYLRRATANRAMYGSPSEHRERLCVLAGL